MVPQNFAVLAKLSFCLKCLQNFSVCLFACACLFLQVLARSVFSASSFLNMLVARKANFCQCLCSQKKSAVSHACKDHSISLQDVGTRRH